MLHLSFLETLFELDMAGFAEFAHGCRGQFYLSLLRRLVAFLALPVGKRQVLARGDQLGIGGAVRIVASGA